MLTSVTVTGLIVGGVGITLLLCRLARAGHFLTIAVLASYGLRVGLAISFYVVSAYQLPVLQNLQLGEGFWRFARDAQWYHWNAAQIAEAFRRGTEIPPLMFGNRLFTVEPDFYLLIAFVYRLLGAHPLYIPLLNATLWSGISISVYLLARRMKGEEAGRIAVLLVSFWPSPYIWSSQILKDTLIIFLVVSGLSLCVLVLRQRVPLCLAAVVPLVPASFLLARLRFYVLPIIVLAVGVEVVPSLVRSSPHRQWGTAVRGLTLMGVLLTIFVGAQSVNYDVLLSRAELYMSYLQKAEYLQAHGDHAAAAKELVYAQELHQRLHSISPPVEVSRGVLRLFQIFSLEQLSSARRGYAGQGGASNVGADVELRGFWNMVAYLPRALANSLYAPFPWDWFSTKGDTGVFRLLSGTEVMLLFAITPFLLVGVIRATRSGFIDDTWLLLAFVAVAAILLGLTITNVGILFRLRLQFLIPLFVVLAAYGADDLRRAAYRLLPRRVLRLPGRGSTQDPRRAGP